MANTELGAGNVIFGTTDETYGYFEDLKIAADHEEVEVTNGLGQITDAVLVDSGKVVVTGTYVYRAHGDPEKAFATGASVTLSDTEAKYPDGTTPSSLTLYVKSIERAKAKGQHMRVSVTMNHYAHLTS